MSEYFICQIDDLPDPGSRGFSIKTDDLELEGFIIRKNGFFYAYLNSCPHTGSPLDWVEHQFLDMDEAFIQCAVHGARFAIDTGLCVMGPCTGDSLQLLSVSRKGGKLFYQT